MRIVSALIGTEGARVGDLLTDLDDLEGDFQTPVKVTGYGDAKTVENSKTYDENEDPTEEQLLSDHGFDPEKWRIDGNIRSSRWMVYDGRHLTSFRFHVVKKLPEGEDLHSVNEAARRRRPKVSLKDVHETALVVVLADPQIGKVDRDGGTKELFERFHDKMDALEQRILTERPERIVIVDVGDLLEGDQTGAANTRELDMQLPEQIEMGALMLTELVGLAEQYAPGEVTVAAVPSNHTRVRQGKQFLGKPTDDFGLTVHRLVQKHFPKVKWELPDTYSESVCFRVFNTQLAATHGHQFRPGGATKWWSGQAHGDLAVAKADILVTGHLHHFAAQATGSDKLWIQAPALDGGSAWFQNVSGEGGRAGLLIFGIDADGFRMDMLDIL